VWALVDPDSLTSLPSAFTLGALETADWFFLLSATMLLVISLALGFSRFGRMRPGRDDQRPEFSPAPTDGGDATDAAVAQSRVP
jgi:choline-glycine betaine transporter